MKNLTALLSLTTLISCGSYYRHPESIGQKMDRYRSKEIRTNITPDFRVTTFKRGRTRGPASAETPSESINNKKVYFLTLLDQYNSMLAMYPSYGKKINLCPRFHQEVIEYKESGKTPNWSAKSTIAPSPIISSIQEDHGNFESAMRAHITRNHDELAQLCEQGSSHNYYIYENLVTLSKEPGVLLGNTDGVNILLKSPIFFNQKLISTVGTKKKSKGRGLASKSNSEDFNTVALQRVNSTWAWDYLNK